MLVAELMLSMIHAAIVLVFLENMAESLCNMPHKSYTVLGFLLFIPVKCVSIICPYCLSAVVHSIRISGSPGNCVRQINGD